MSADVDDDTFSRLNPIQEMVLRAVLEGLGEGASEEEVGRAVEAAQQAMHDEGARVLHSGLRKHLPVGMRAEVKVRRGFERRNLRRWGPAFDLLEMMLVCSGEHAEAVSALYGKRAASEGDLGFLAIKHLHAKSILIGREVLHLCRGGYPDGALARWRSLHEVATTALFLSRHGNEIAGRFLASFQHRAVKAAEQLNRFAERANLEPFTEEELNQLRAVRDSDGLGPDKLSDEYEWARPALSISPKKRVSFADLEESVGLDHWRPRYRWASQHTHAPFRPLNNTLGEAETKTPVFLIGPSNSGMVDPLQMAACSLCVAEAAFFLRYPDMDRTVGVAVQSLVADQIGPLALKLQTDSLARARRLARLPRWLHWSIFDPALRLFDLAD